MWEFPGSRGWKPHRNSLKNLNDNGHKGRISNPAATKIKNAVNWLVASAPKKRVYDKKTGKHFYFKIAFVTLTIPAEAAGVTDNFFKKELLHPWLIMAKTKFGLKNYIWKVETTEKGTIHAHITIDAFIHHKNLRDTWNRILSKKGVLASYEAAHGHSNANSTDIHSVRNIENIAGYLCKYLTKSDDARRKVNGRLWGCNYELSHKNGLVVYVDPYEAQQVSRDLFKKEIDFKELVGKPDLLGQCQKFGELFFVRPGQWGKVLQGELARQYDIHRFHIRHNVWKPPPDYYLLN